MNSKVHMTKDNHTQRQIKEQTPKVLSQHHHQFLLVRIHLNHAMLGIRDTIWSVVSGSPHT